MGKPKKPITNQPTSKTAKRSAIKGKDDEFIPAPASDLSRIIPLCNGEFAYVLDLKGKTHHLQTNSEMYLTLVEELADR